MWIWSIRKLFTFLNEDHVNFLHLELHIRPFHTWSICCNLVAIHLVPRFKENLWTPAKPSHHVEMLLSGHQFKCSCKFPAASVCMWDRLNIMYILSHSTLLQPVVWGSKFSKLLTTKHAHWTFAVSFLFSNVFIIYRTQFSHLCTKTDNQDVPTQGRTTLWFVFHILLIAWIQYHFWVYVHKHGLLVTWCKQEPN